MCFQHQPTNMTKFEVPLDQIWGPMLWYSDDLRSKFFKTSQEIETCLRGTVFQHDCSLVPRELVGKTSFLFHRWIYEIVPKAHIQSWQNFVEFPAYDGIQFYSIYQVYVLCTYYIYLHTHTRGIFERTHTPPKSKSNLVPRLGVAKNHGN